jgi:hypothetical protein
VPPHRVRDRRAAARRPPPTSTLRTAPRVIPTPSASPSPSWLRSSVTQPNFHPRRLRLVQQRQLGQARARVSRSPPCLVQHRAADGLRGHTYREFAELLGSSTEPDGLDPVRSDEKSADNGGVDNTRRTPRLAEHPRERRRRRRRQPLKEESAVPLRSNGSLSMNRALMAAGLVDYVQLTLFPVISGRTGWTRSSRVRPTSTWS